ncbi:optic atrophy 3 protein-like [Microtus pennsylvanicus]|uniref:optic atrophy 3 protein-like n=1 Tax=Microtus pennsylvanicus TaxID=10058 RepID=UPI003F6BF402
MRTKLRIMGFHAEAVKPLNEAAAAELGANLLGEAIIFACAGSCLLLEFWRQQSLKHRKEVERVASLRSLRADLDRLEQALNELQVQVQAAAVTRSTLEELRAELRAELQEFRTQICEEERQEPESQPSEGPE